MSTPHTIISLKIGVQLFRTNDVVSERIVKTLIIKYGIYANILQKKYEWLLHLQKLLT